MIRLLFFGRLSDYAGPVPATVKLSAAASTPAQIRNALSRHRELYQALHQPQVMVAVNQQISDWNRPLRSGDEVAFLPPVTGG